MLVRSDVRIRSFESRGDADGKAPDVAHEERGGEIAMRELEHYSRDRPLLLLTDFAPNMGGGGAVILRSLLQERDRERMVWGSPLLASGDGASAGTLPLRTPAGRLRRWLGRRSITVDSLFSSAIADAVASSARDLSARAIWIVMHGAMVHVAARLSDRTHLPLHLSVHDDPPYGVGLMSRRHLGLIPFVARDLGLALRRARSIDVISAGMARRYESLYGVKPVVVHRGIEGPVKSSPPYDPASGLRIGVLGNTYSHHQLFVLVGAVARAAAAIGARGRLLVIGQGAGARVREYARGQIEVEVTGHLDERAAIERLKSCFLLYLNYPFSFRAAVLRQTSFPTKLSTYVMAARPLLQHAPRDSSLADLSSLTDYVAVWPDERIETGAESILRAWNDSTLHQSRDVQAEAIRRRYYDLEKNRATLFRALNGLVAPS
jgi:hypothetical protein